MTESAQLFGNAAALVGVLTEPDTEAHPDRPALILLNSGLIHRVAPQRLYVRLARAVAERGFASLRFDFSGIGDSSVRVDGLPMEDAGIAETREAMDLVTRRTGRRRFVLLGLCGGGYFSFRTATVDERVRGLILLNVRGHLHGDDSELHRQLVERAMIRHYRRIALSRTYRLKNLRKLVAGRFDLRGALRSLTSIRRQQEASPSAASDGAALTALLERGVRILNLYSEGDWSLDYVEEALGGRAAERLSEGSSEFDLLRGTNHVFTPRWSQDRVVERIGSWLERADWSDAASPPAG